MMPISPATIREIRQRIDVSQKVFARVFDVHSMTVSKWEQGLLTPNEAHQSLLRALIKAADNNMSNTWCILESNQLGYAARLYKLLHTAFITEDKEIL